MKNMYHPRINKNTESNEHSYQKGVSYHQSIFVFFRYMKNMFCDPEPYIENQDIYRDEKQYSHGGYLLEYEVLYFIEKMSIYARVKLFTW